MFFPEGHIRVWLYGEPVDMRKSFDGLYALARHGLKQDPLNGQLFAFVNRRATHIKVLYFDRSGWCLWAKRLEAGRFIGNWSAIAHREMDCTELKLLLEGIKVKRRHKRYRLLPDACATRRCTRRDCRDNRAMPSVKPTRLPDAAEVATLAPEQIARMLQGQARVIDELKRQVEWFKRQLFGRKSERFAPEPDAQQMHLGQVLGEELPGSTEIPDAGSRVPAHTRRKPRSDFADDAAAAPFFDETKVPVETIEVPNPEVRGLAPEHYEVIGQKTSYRLAQRPGSFVVLKYVRPVIKRRDTQTLHCPAAPVGVIEGSRADVSFVAGVLVDKFCWHLPLYRQHQRLLDAGFKLSRPWLTQLVRKR